MRQLRDATYDAVIVGGGLAGSSLAARLAKHGKRVLVLERTRQFRDRVRGEGMHSWGVPELRALGLYDRLMETCAHEARYWVTYGPPALARARDLIQTTPHHAAVVDFYHPRMQEVLLRLAAEAGAEIGRGVSITHICGAHSPAVKARCEGREARFRARLVVGADGRQSAVRRDAGFTVARDPERIRISGVLLAGMRTAEDAVHVFVAPTFGHVCLLFPLGGERFRVYFTTGRRREHRPLSGAGDIAEFCRYCIETGVPAQWIGHARMAGPLATFEGADVWVDHPYAEGIVLVGDAAAANDPCFGSGLSLTLRDVRVLVDLLSTTDDWDAAGHRYAAAHDRYYGSLHKITSWLREVRYALGPEADRLREHALPRLADGSGPDLIGMGPEARADACAVLADRVT
jgi:2-polyprenyl-6-methoxyphenol hydroxylase-like FAD-dependent oxidoreductase